MFAETSDDSDSDSSSDYEDIVVAVPVNNNSDMSIRSEQWVKLIENCSYKQKYEQSIPRGIGIEKLCQATDVNFGDKDKIDNGWILNNTNQQEYFIVSFQTPVFINELHIYESLNPGSIIKLEMLESQKNQWYTLWQQKSHTNSKSLSPTVFKPILRRYRFQSNTVRITIDPRYADQVGFQAIKLIGTNGFDVNFCRRTLLESMLMLYKQTLDNNKTDAQFLVDNKIINAHRNILCCRSLYFRTLLSNNSQKNPIELTDVDYDTFIEILFFIYTSNYHQTISYDMAFKCMIYCHNINLLSGKNVAIEKLIYYIRSNHGLIISTYCRIKQMSPKFDFFLRYIYDLCSQNMNEICKQKEFFQLDKDLIIDLIYHSSERNNTNEQENN
ncbi:unnamed protein product [Adineta steineri]|uniref:BTB domain-containing protein n=1 Tax=Adineta steineri TaxID=433720 RepID=A0A815AL71_9BILA|nr:unnamed protein product [Adineta steineri]CAF4049692.1 unnamed protein product [Adineta steineri]